MVSHPQILNAKTLNDNLNARIDADYKTLTESIAFTQAQIEAAIEYATDTAKEHPPWTTALVVGTQIRNMLDCKWDEWGRTKSILLFHLKTYGRFLVVYDPDEPLWTFWTGGVVCDDEVKFSPKCPHAVGMEGMP